VDRNEHAFARMRDAARSLSQSMDGFVTDDNGVAVSEQAMEQIGSDLEALYDRLDERDLAAGSAAARRLFS
jgi:FtsZ-interacting cell division protein ZipA